MNEKRDYGFIKTFFTSGIPFGFFMGLFFGLTTDYFIGLIAGLFCGFFFGFVIAIFSVIQKKKFRNNLPEGLNKQDILYDGPANHFRGMESVGGWLFLTKDRLLFKSHKYNIQNHETAILLDQVIELKSALTLGIIPNSILLKTTSENVEKFVVSNRKTWLKQLTNLLPHTL